MIASRAQATLTRLPQVLAEVCGVLDNEASRTDATAEFPTATLTTMRRTGLLGLMAPTALGGLGGSLTDLVDTTMALARRDLSAALIFAMHCQQVVVLDRFASEPVRTQALTDVSRGDAYVGSVTTEAGTGGDLLTSESRTKRRDGWVHVDRSAPIVTGGTHADAFLITVLAPGARSPAQVALVFAKREQLKLEVLGDWRAMGMRGTQSIPMRLVGDLPERQVLERARDFRTIVASTYGPLAHLGWAAAWLGSAAGACSRVLRHVRSTSGRTAFDPGSDLLLTNLATVRAKLDVVHALLRHTVSVIERCDEPAAVPVQLLVNALKAHAADECFSVVDRLVQLVGLRHGYLEDSPLRLERTFRDLRSASLNYANERLLLANGAMALRDGDVRFA